MNAKGAGAGKLELLMSGAKGGANRSANFLIQSSGNSNFGTVFLAERANFLIQIFLGKNRESRWTPRKKKCYMPVAASGTGGEKEKKSQKRRNKAKAKTG